MAWRTLTPLCCILIALLIGESARSVEANFLNEPFAMEQTCRSVQTKIHINREENDDFGNPLRSCEGSVEVTKCEGTCNSQVQPSLSAPHGFHKVRSRVTGLRSKLYETLRRSIGRRQTCGFRHGQTPSEVQVLQDPVIYFCSQTNPFVFDKVRVV